MWCPGMGRADLMLIDVTISEQVAERYRQVVISSGNHAFVVCVVRPSRGLVAA